jgi:hypothetical protein
LPIVVVVVVVRDERGDERVASVLETRAFVGDEHVSRLSRRRR